jgi:hypothetical protein
LKVTIVYVIRAGTDDVLVVDELLELALLELDVVVEVTGTSMGCKYP